MIEKSTISAQVAHTIRQRILSGEYKCGDKLPQEKIAAELGISRMPVREALHQLHSEGFINLVSHKGAIVSRVSVNQIRELFELRARVETWLLSLAIPNISKSHLDKAQERLDRLHIAEAPESWNRRNWDFHAALYEAAARPATMAFLHRIHLQIEPYTRMLVMFAGSQKEGDREHELLLTLCREGDQRQAVYEIDSHIIRSSERLLESLKFAASEDSNALQAANKISAHQI